MSKITFGIFSLGMLGLGFGVGYLLCKKQLEASYQRDLDEVKEQLQGLKRQNGEGKSEMEPEEEPDSEFYISEVEDGSISEKDQQESLEHLNTLVNQTLYAGQGKGKPIISYNKVKPELKAMAEKIKKQLEEDGIYDEDIGMEEDSKEDEGDMEESSEDVEKIGLDSQTMYEAADWAEKHSDAPYLIDYDDFEENEPKYEREALFFYNEDAVLCDEDDKIIDEYEDLIGYEWEKVFFRQTNAWVRNDNLKTMYEIHSVPQAYSEVVAGFIGTDREREFNRKARMKQIMDQ